MKHNSVTFVQFSDETFQCRVFLDDIDTTFSFSMSREEMERTIKRLPEDAVKMLLGPQLTALVKGKP
jgi:hypothetical protein